MFYLCIGLAALSGAINILNKMINLEAKRHLGTGNGTLINYVEGTLIALTVVLLIGNSKFTQLEYIKEIPVPYFLGGVFGLGAMLLSMMAMPHVRVAYAAVVILIGQLGTGLVIDSVISGGVNVIKVVGIILVGCGIGWEKWILNKTA